MSNVFSFWFDFRFFWKITEFPIFHFPNVLIEASIVTFIEIFMQFNPFNKLLFKDSSIFFVNIKVVKNQSGNLFNQGVIWSSLDGNFSISNFQDKSRLLCYMGILTGSLTLESIWRFLCKISI